MKSKRHAATRTYPPQPPRERGTWRAFALAALMHVLLALFLYHGVHWQNSTPAGAEAELWTAAPEIAAPPQPVVTPPPIKVAPPPPPVRNEEADIALQQKKRQQEAAARDAQLAAEREKQKQAEKLRQKQLAEQQKLEQQKLEQQKQAQLDAQQAARAKAEATARAKAEAKAKADATAKTAKAEAAAKARAEAASQAKLDQERRTRLAQLQGMAGSGEGGGEGLAKSGTGTGSGGNAASPGYADKVRRRVKPNVVWGGERAGLVTVLAIRCTPSGDVMKVSVARSSGNTGWDQAVVNAVQASVPLPPDSNGRTPSNITITFKAEE